MLNDYTAGDNPTLQGNLAQFEAVFWSATGGGFGDVHNAATFTNLSAFVQAGGPWDIVVVDMPSATPTGGFAPLIDYVNSGGRCVMSFWDWDAIAGLPQAFGTTGTSTKLNLMDGATSFAATAAGTNSGIFNGITMPNSSWHNHWTDDGDSFSLAAGTTSLGTIAGAPVMIRKGDGRAIASFVLDEAGDTWLNNGSGVNLWKNMINEVLGDAAVDILVFNDFTQHDLAEIAVTSIDGAGIVVANAANFNARLTGGFAIGEFGMANAVCPPD